ncbi:hypothetical protein GM658_23850 [Pseudoduganella eburnea]|uniref:DUF2946 domain-containing protein n=1 Tax=Massilia eburnea TaxID=1776165 RepID=A0A6L6QMJ6_9BURK|nr:hypothetical protein [Massilia eburnea]MTW13648.1 hypothetical protein [Massilia eburnea]
MKSVIRIVALWLMLVALPFQGFASASMLLCGPAKPMPPLAQEVQPGHGAHHDHAAMLASGQHDHSAGQGNCHGGVMGDCCVGAALAYGLPQAATCLQRAERLRLRDAVPPLPVDLALPKRPPRAILA